MGLCQPARRSARGATGLRLQPPARLPDRLPDSTSGPVSRVGVMLHLPGLVQTKQIDKVFRGFQKINLAVRGLLRRCSQASGDFYQISSQQTLGKSRTSSWIKILTDVVPQVLLQERTARQAPCDRAAGSTSTTRSVAAYGSRSGPPRRSRARGNQVLLLSSCAAGINLGLIDDLLDRHRQRALHPDSAVAFLQKLRGSELGVEERNVARASYLRVRLSNGRQAPRH